MTRISCSVLFFVTGLTSVVATEYNPLMDTLLDQFLELNNQVRSAPFLVELRMSSHLSFGFANPNLPIVLCSCE